MPLPAPDADEASTSGRSPAGAGSGRGKHSQPAPAAFGIVEIVEEVEEEQRPAGKVWQLQQLVRRLLLACATHCEAPPPPSGDGDGEPCTLPLPSLPDAWSDAGCSAACMEVLQQLVACVTVSPGSGTSSSDRGSCRPPPPQRTRHTPPPPWQQQLQPLLAAMLPLLLEELRPVLFAQQRHEAEQEEGGPGAVVHGGLGQQSTWRWPGGRAGVAPRLHHQCQPPPAPPLRA
jgi:hypothetical protein